MPPPRMKGNIEIGVGRLRDLDGEIGGGFEAAQIDPEIRQFVVEAFVQQQVRPLAHGGGAQQRQRGVGVGAHAQYFSSGRPTVPAGPGDTGSGE